MSWLKPFLRYFEKSFTFSNFTFPLPFSPKTASKTLKENHLTARLSEISMCRKIPIDSHYENAAILWERYL